MIESTRGQVDTGGASFRGVIQQPPSRIRNPSLCFVQSYAVVDILFHPVITTRRVVERDSTSRSGYIAHTVNPSSNVQIKNELQMSNDHNTKQGCQVRGPTVNSPTVSAPTHPPHPQPSESPDRPASQMNRLSLETPVSTTKTLLLWLS